jgi:biotin carboxyl carrier protein
MKKEFRITLNNKTYDVVAEIIGEEDAPVPIVPRAARRTAAAAAAPAASSAAPKAAAAPAGKGDIPSPLAGKVVSIDVQKGASVKAGDQVITLEAMKMNTVVSASTDGTVEAILVAPGDSVEEGQPLMTIV